MAIDADFQEITNVDVSGMFAEDTGGKNLPAVAGASAVSISDGIITAQRCDVKRDLAHVLHNIKTLAAMAGEGWYYSLPTRNKDGSQGRIEGPSIKCANDIAREYGNCQIDSRAKEHADHWMIAARFVDYETGFSMSRLFRQRRNQRSVGTGDPGRQEDIAFQIGQSKAIRNVVTNALQTIADYAFQLAKQNLADRVGKNLDSYRARVLERFEEMRVDIRRVERVVGKTTAEWSARDVARLIAEIKAVTDNMITADEVWPVATAPVNGAGGNGSAPPPPKREDFVDKGQSTQAGNGQSGNTQAAAKPAETKPAAEQTAAKPAAASKPIPDDAPSQRQRVPGAEAGQPVADTPTATGTPAPTETAEPEADEPDVYVLYDHAGTEVTTTTSPAEYIGEYGRICLRAAKEGEAALKTAIENNELTIEEIQLNGVLGDANGTVNTIHQQCWAIAMNGAGKTVEPTPAKPTLAEPATAEPTDQDSAAGPVTATPSRAAADASPAPDQAADPSAQDGAGDVTSEDDGTGAAAAQETPAGPDPAWIEDAKARFYVIPKKLNPTTASQITSWLVGIREKYNLASTPDDRAKFWAVNSEYLDAIKSTFTSVGQVRALVEQRDANAKAQAEAGGV